MKYTTQQIVEVRAKLRLINSMLARVADDLGDLSVDRTMKDEHRKLFEDLSYESCKWSHRIDQFNETTQPLTKE